MSGGSGDVAALVAAIEPFDETERAHRGDALAWLDRTPDIYRRARPATPPRHLVSYAFLTDPRDGSVFLVDHRLSGLWLPAGGHVEPGEEPSVTAEREAREELAIEADFSIAGRRPAFVTVTPPSGRSHTLTSACGTCWPAIRGCPSCWTRGSSPAAAGGAGRNWSPLTRRCSIHAWAASWQNSAAGRERRCWRRPGREAAGLVCSFGGHSPRNCGQIGSEFSRRGSFVSFGRSSDKN